MDSQCSKKGVRFSPDLGRVISPEASSEISCVVELSKSRTRATKEFKNRYSQTFPKEESIPNTTQPQGGKYSTDKGRGDDVNNNKYKHIKYSSFVDESRNKTHQNISYPKCIQDRSFIETLNYQERIGIPFETSCPSFQKKLFIVSDDSQSGVTHNTPNKNTPEKFSPISKPTPYVNNFMNTSDFTTVGAQRDNSIRLCDAENNISTAQTQYSNFGASDRTIDSYKSTSSQGGYGNNSMVNSSNSTKPHFKRTPSKKSTNNATINSGSPNSNKMGSLSNAANMSENNGTPSSDKSVSPLKEQLECLNNRLSAYVQHVRQNDTMIPTSPVKTKRNILEQEVEILRGHYEREMEALRLAVGESKMAVLHKRVISLQEQLSEAEGAVANNMDTKQMTERCHSAESTNQRIVERLKLQLDDFRQRYERELLHRQQVQLEHEQLQKKFEFAKKMSEQEIAELRSECDTSNDAITDLQSTVQQLGSVESSLPGIMEKVREMAEAEVLKIQASSQEDMRRYIEAQRIECESDQDYILQLQTAKTQDSIELSRLRARVNDLQSQLQNMEHQKDSLQKQLIDERRTTNDHMTSSDAKLREMYAVMSAKNTVVPESNAGLKAEVEAYNLLLDQEEKRLGRPLSAPSNVSTPSRKSPVLVHPHSSHLRSNITQTENIAKQPIEKQVEVPATSLDHNRTDYYIYETDPSDNYLHYEPIPQTTNQNETDELLSNGNRETELLSNQITPRRPIGPVLQKPKEQTMDSGIADGADYFNEMFYRDNVPPHISPHPPLSSSCHDYRVDSVSATGSIRFLEVHKDGTYIRLLNDGTQDLEIGNYMIQQNVGGHPVAVFRFPPKTKMAATNTTTVWAGCCETRCHIPPTDFYWMEQERWGTGPECTTILCRPNGQAIAWTTAAHRFTKNLYDDARSNSSSSISQRDEIQKNYLQQLGELKIAKKPEPVYLVKRKKMPTPKLSQPSRSPYTGTAGDLAHPHSSPPRPHTHGSDGSGVNRQMRGQSSVPNLHNGQPYAGSGNPTQRTMYSSPSRSTRTGHKGSNGRQINSAPVIGSAVQCPSPFMKPHARYAAGLSQLQDQFVDHHRN